MAVREKGRLRVAQTKTKSRAKKSTAKRSGSSSRGSRSSNPKSNGSSGSSRAKAKASEKSASASNGVADSVKRGASGIAPLARKARAPLVASGAALAGVAGAIAATRSNKRPKVLGVSMPKNGISMPRLNGTKPDARKISAAVVDAAKRADRFGQGVSRVASSVRNVGETANEVAKKT